MNKPTPDPTNYAAMVADCERRFGRGNGYMALCGWLGKTVRTPKGTGTLLQVFKDRASVAMGESKPGGLSRAVQFFKPDEIEVIQ